MCALCEIKHLMVTLSSLWKLANYNASDYITELELR